MWGTDGLPNILGMPLWEDIPETFDVLQSEVLFDLYLVIPIVHVIPQSIIMLSSLKPPSFILDDHQRIFVLAKLIACGISATKGFV